MMKERTIYIKDLIFHIIQKWKLIIVWMLLFSIVANGCSIIKSYKNMISSQQQSSSQSIVENVTENLSEEDKTKAEEISKIYSAYKNALDCSVNYYENSIKMKLDPSNVPTIYIQYQISGSQDVSDIVSAYSKCILSDESLNKIKNSAEIDEDLNCINELIEFNPDERKQIDDEQVNEKKDMSSALMIRIVALNQEMCENIADVIEDEVKTYTQNIQDKLGKFELVQVDRNYSNIADQNLLEEQQDYLMKMDSIKVSIDNLNSSLTSEQQEYYKILINKNENINDDNNNVVKVQFVNLKVIVIGLLIGAILAFVWIVFTYVLNNCLKVSKELEDYYGVQVFDSFTMKDSKKKGIIYRSLKLVDNKSESEKLQLISANIEAIADKKNINHIHITSVSDSEEVEMMKEKICREVEKDSFKITRGKSIFNEVTSLKNLVEADGVILIEQVGKSVFDDIGKEIKLCLKNDVSIIGAVVIE